MPLNQHLSEEGSGTIASVGIIACVVLVGCALFAAAHIQAESTRVQACADMAALAGAKCVQKSTITPDSFLDPCECSDNIASVNGTLLEECWQDGQDLRVIVSKPWALFQWEIAIKGKARAGPL